MNLYEKYILPKVVHHTCGIGPVMKQRKKIVPFAEGNVLEIGFGSGRNLAFYDPAKIKRLWALEPSREMWSLAENAVRKFPAKLDYLENGAEDVPLENRSVDTIVVTFSLCTIPAVDTALAEARRVLKSGGQLLFCEHGIAPDASVRRWQNRLNPVWKIFSGGCNLNRQVPQIIENAGFTIAKMDTMYLPGWKPATFNYWGIAVNP